MCFLTNYKDTKLFSFHLKRSDGNHSKIANLGIFRRSNEFPLFFYILFPVVILYRYKLKMRSFLLRKQDTSHQ